VSGVGCRGWNVFRKLGVGYSVRGVGCRVWIVFRKLGVGCRV